METLLHGRQGYRLSCIVNNMAANNMEIQKPGWSIRLLGHWLRCQNVDTIYFDDANNIFNASKRMSHWSDIDLSNFAGSTNSFCVIDV